MAHGPLVLKDSHKANSLENISAAQAGTDNLKHSKQSSIKRAVHKTSGNGLASMDCSCKNSETSPKPHTASNIFASPLKALSESLNDPDELCISIHDLIEAYNVLCNRLRSQANDIFSTTEPHPCLFAFAERSSDIMDCLARDLRRVLPSPFETQSFGGGSFKNWHYPEITFSEEDLELASDNATLCYHALRFVSSIVTFTPLYNTFSHDQLCSVLQDALMLCTPTPRPILNLQKSRGLVLWILKVQQLPASVLLSAEDMVVSAMKSSLLEEIGGLTGKKDAFMAIHFILEKHPRFIRPFLELLPIVLDHLNFGDLDIQMHAAYALSGFALAKLDANASPKFPLSQVAEIVQDYIDVQTARNKPRAEARLPAMFKAALEGDQHWQASGASFTLTVASVLIVLLDHHFFSKSRSLKLIFSLFPQIAGHRRSNVQNTLPEVWRIMIWAFSRFPRDVDGSRSVDDLTTLEETRDRCYRVVVQELRHGLGVDLVATLLRGSSTLDSYRRADDVGKAVSTLVDMVESKHVSCREDGRALLRRLSSGIGTPTSTSSASPVDRGVSFWRQLVDGSLLQQPARSISVPSTVIPVESILPLAEAEVVQHWDALSKAWISLVQRFLTDSSASLPSDFTDSWQALLLAQSHLSQGHQHLTTSSAFAAKVASIINIFSITLDVPDAQARYLAFINKLWSVLKNVFAPSWLSSPAEIILASLLKKQFTLSDDQVRTSWSQLCADLISVGMPSLLHVLHVRSESQEGAEVTRQLWTILARDRLAADGDDWLELLYLLPMPFGTWIMDDDEFELWDGLFVKALDIGSSCLKSEEVVISRLVKSLEDGSKLQSMRLCCKAIISLISHSAAVPCRSVIPKLLPMLDAAFYACYKKMHDEKEAAFDTLRTVAEVLSSTLESDMVEAISALQEGLCRWLADEDAALDDEEHKEVLETLYGKPLEKLSGLPPSRAVLETLAKFLHSVFVRIRGDGPVLFQRFWRSTYHKRPDISPKDYPVLIQSCLKAWSDFCGDSLAHGVSFDSASQSLKSYTIPDSQGSPSKGPPGDDIFLDEGTGLDLERGLQRGDRSGSRETITPRSRKRSLSPSHEDRYPLLESPFAPLSLPRVGVDDLPRTPKRRRTGPWEAFQFPGVKRGQILVHDSSIPSAKSRQQESASEPVTRTSSMAQLNPISASQPSQPRRPHRDEETPSWVGSEVRRLRDGIYSGDRDREEGLSSRIARHPPMASSDDYDTWEKGISAQDLHELQQNPDLRFSEEEDKDAAEDDERDKLLTSPMQDDLSPSVGDYPSRSRRRYRSQTAPELSMGPESHSLLAGVQPLRRNQTSPLEHRRTTSAQLDALQHAYAIITDTGASQVDVQDIMQARRLANQINQLLDEQMCRKFGANTEA
ncbi:unnamed protein product [Cyclocybe aegerita]|uniref:Telomere-associated protein Rif1 N-terminal domain-containing protein n=1 Tax=Cyclocybe aegerita TaxID=1973307 RepID=A0A8S0VTU2_CYCAE|nr:unnamed protein product [Cyclocybe aegerita]